MRMLLSPQLKKHSLIGSSISFLFESDVVVSLQDERLLMIMSNLSYVVSQVVPRLFDCFVSHGYPHCYDVQEVRITMAPLPHLQYCIINLLDLPFNTSSITSSTSSSSHTIIQHYIIVFTGDHRAAAGVG